MQRTHGNKRGLTDLCLLLALVLCTSILHGAPAVPVADGPMFPPAPWEGLQVADGPMFPPAPWEGLRIAA
ncbi:MAG TPA: hypothetical protein VKT49_06610 [Bryobacteraceae bacterium]|nr:hypothetical protein [Bryobacteraceae bacterium]